MGREAKTEREGIVSTRIIKYTMGVLVVACAAALAPAVASTTPTKVPSPQQALEALKAKLAAQGGPKASATVGTAAATVACGQTIKASTTLTADLNCPSSSGIIIGANSVVLNLNGHFISGTTGFTGVGTTFNSDTVENGYVLGFSYNVELFGRSDIATKLTLDNGGYGAFTNGFSDQVTSSTAAGNSYGGISIGGYNAIVKADHLLNNTMDGLQTSGHATQILDNIANGNGRDGIDTFDSPPATLTGNTADFNDLWGIHAQNPQIDGGTNKAQGNTQHEQCYGVVCSPT